VVDEYTRECHLIHVARNIRAVDVLRQLFRLIEQHGTPEFIRSDNGSEFIEKSLRTRLCKAEIKTFYIDPGSPWQNGYIESFHSRFRDERLEREQLWTLTEARMVLEDRRREYNEERPHKRLELETPKAYARAQQAGFSGRATPSLRPRLDNASITGEIFTLQPGASTNITTGPVWWARPVFCIGSRFHYCQPL